MHLILIAILVTIPSYATAFPLDDLVSYFRSTRSSKSKTKGGEVRSPAASIFDHRSVFPDENDIEKTKEFIKFRAALNEMGADFNCKKAKITYGRISAFNTPMTNDDASCIADQTSAPIAYNDYLQQMTHVNEWTYLTVVAGEYINQLDQATYQLFGSNFDWEEIKEINPYCDQFSEITEEARSKRADDKSMTKFAKFFSPIPNPIFKTMLEQLKERPAKELIDNGKLKHSIDNYTFVELLTLHKTLDDQLSSLKTGRTMSCIREIGGQKVCDYSFFDTRIRETKLNLKIIERNIRTKETQFPYLAQSYEHANSITDLSNLMSFYDLHVGREELNKLKEKYNALIEKKLTEKDLQTIMHGAFAPTIVEKKKQYKNLIAGICSSNIPTSQTRNIGMPWTVLTSADHILNKIEKSNPQFEGYSQCLRDATNKREKSYGAAAMAGAALCFGSAIGLGIATAGTASLIVSPLCGAVFFGLDATPKIESSKTLSSSISCQQLIGKETCSEEERQRIEDMDWWATFATTSSVVGEFVGIGMDAFSYGSKTVRALRLSKIKSAQEKELINKLFHLQEFHSQQEVIFTLGQVNYQKAKSFIDEISSSAQAEKYFYPYAFRSDKIAIIEEYLKRNGLDPSNAAELFDNVESILKVRGASLDHAAKIFSQGDHEIESLRRTYSLAYDLLDGKYFDEAKEAKLNFLKSKYPMASDEQIRVIKESLDSVVENSHDPQGLLNLIKELDRDKDVDVTKLFDPDNFDEAIERSRRLGHEGLDSDLADAILTERIIAIWSIEQKQEIGSILKSNIADVLNDPKVREGLISLNKKTCP